MKITGPALSRTSQVVARTATLSILEKSLQAVLGGQFSDSQRGIYGAAHRHHLPDLDALEATCTRHRLGLDHRQLANVLQEHQSIWLSPFCTSTGDRKSLSIAKNHPKPSQEFSEQFGPSIHIKLWVSVGFHPPKVPPNFAKKKLGNTNFLESLLWPQF